MAALRSNGTWLSRIGAFGLPSSAALQSYRDLLRILWENKGELPYAWNILNHGMCDACSLGVYGLRDNLLGAIHLCAPRLKLLKLNTASALEPPLLRDVERLRNLPEEKLRSLGRLPYPMLRLKNHKSFVRVGWQEAFDLIAQWVRPTAPSEMAFLAGSRRLTNELYYVFQKLARSLGTNNIDLCSRLGHGAGVKGLKNTLGIGASTCSLRDFIGTDLLVLFGTPLTDNHPVFTAYMQLAKAQGTRIVVINPARPQGTEHAGAAPTSLFDDKLPDDCFPVRTGGDVAFINGVLKSLLEANQLDDHFIMQRTSGFVELKASLDKQCWHMLEQRSGLARAAMKRFSEFFSQAKSAVLVYSTGLTQHKFGVHNVEAVVNLALARGMLGREKCGIMAVGEDSGVQGGLECGMAPDKFAGDFMVNDENARRFSNLWRHPVSSAVGLKPAQMIKAAERDEIQFIYCAGANLFEAHSEHGRAAEAAARVRFRVHQDIVLNSSMLLDAQEAVLLLPAQTRYEQRTGGTSTSSERCIRFMPELPGHRIGESLPDWEIPALIGRKAMSNGELLFPFNDTQSIREEMSRTMPIYKGVEKLTREGDWLQWGGPCLHQDGFSNMPNYRARFTALEPPNELQRRPGSLSARTSQGAR